MKCTVWYMRPEMFPYLILGPAFAKESGHMPTKETLSKTHIELTTLNQYDDADAVFVNMQAEVWSPMGEAFPLIKRKGLSHTSMCVGDVIVWEDGRAVMCDNRGWMPL